jgi:hypothetical protein
VRNGAYAREDENVGVQRLERIGLDDDLAILSRERLLQ